MQRCFFFVFMCASGLLLNAQPAKLSKVELSFWLASAQIKDSVVKAEAVLHFDFHAAADSLLLVSRDLQIRQIRKREGRLKQSFPYKLRGDSLWIYGQFHTGDQTQLHISYQFSLTDTTRRDLVQSSQGFLALNPFNAQAEISAGKAGVFYPTIRGDSAVLDVNLTIDKGNNSSLPGTLQFMTRNGDGSISHFWSSYNKYTAAQFFLVTGDFEETDPDELHEELPLVEIDTEKLRADRIRDELSPFLNKLSGDTGFGDRSLLVIDSLAEREMSGFFVKLDEVPLPPKQFRLHKSALLYLHNYDTARASQRLLNLYSDRFGAEWEQQLIAKRWAKWRELSSGSKRHTLELKLSLWQENSPWLDEFNQKAVDTGFYQPLLQSLQLPKLTLDYRYVAADTAQYIGYSQDTSAAPSYSIPAKITLINQRDTITTYHFMNQAEGRLKISTDAVPQYVGVDLGEHFPGRLSDQKPETYYLYLLSNAESKEQRSRALVELFKTSNSNLFSTVVGIALNDPNPQLRLQGLEQAEKLNAAGQQKLKDSLLRLSSEDPNTEARRKAKSLVEKYYSGK